MSKTQYELYLRARVAESVEDDFETIDFEPCGNYRDAVKLAKSFSKRVPFKNYHGQEIAQVQIAAYIDDEEKYGTHYQLLWKETYENGVGCGRY